jgi:3-hydroxymyristoyl/3-hydroxydecanoyl-(acyl carrier protein) dehydratase
MERASKRKPVVQAIMSGLSERDTGYHWYFSQNIQFYNRFKTNRKIMLQGDFFNIQNLETAGFDIKADLVINAAHKIFEGHFPGHPVVPGVCMMQMVKEIMEQVFKKKTNLVSAVDMKFLNIINRKKTPISRPH